MAIRFGVIGLGNWGLMHVATFQSHPSAELTAVCDADADKAKRVAQEHGVPRWYDEYAALLADPQVDAVSIVTPDFAHTEIALAALQAGKHVLIEKPLATTLEDCQKIVAAADRSDKKFMVDFHNRWNPTFAKTKTYIERGELGQVRLIYLRLNDQIFVPTEMLSWAGRSTVSWFIGSHCVDTILWLAGKPIERVYTVKRSGLLRSMGIDTPDFYESILELEGGGVAVMENCWILPNSTPSLIDFKCEIIGTEGTVYIDGSHHRALARYTKQEAGYPDVIVCPRVHGQVKGFAVESIRYFVDCLATDREPMCTARDGLAVTKVILAMERSAAEGQPVSVG